MAIAAPRYSIQDLEQFPDDGNRYELLDGVLLVTPSPSIAHQSVASRLHVALARAVQSPGHGLVLGPGVVVRPPNTQLQPDILVVPAGFPLSARWDEIPGHWLAVEILSPSSRIYDRDFKRKAYLALGVREVWIVDSWEKTVEVSSAITEDSRVLRDSVEFNPPVRDVLVRIDLRDIFAGLD